VGSTYKALANRAFARKVERQGAETCPQAATSTTTSQSSIS
jgi:hypothetical protein